MQPTLLLPTWAVPSRRGAKGGRAPLRFACVPPILAYSNYCFWNIM